VGVEIYAARRRSNHSRDLLRQPEHFDLTSLEGSDDTDDEPDLDAGPDAPPMPPQPMPPQVLAGVPGGAHLLSRCYIQHLASINFGRLCLFEFLRTKS
jgi:hypothetical protein